MADRRRAAPPFLAALLLAVLAPGPLAGTADAGFDQDMQGLLNEGNDLWTILENNSAQYWYDYVYHDLCTNGVPFWAPMTHVCWPDGAEENPGVFVDDAVESVVDQGPAPIDLPVRLASGLWGRLIGLNFWGVRDYQRVPFIRDVAWAYDCADHASILGGYARDCWVACDYEMYGSVLGSDGESSMERYESGYTDGHGFYRACGHNRVTLLTYALWIILDHARACMYDHYSVDLLPCLATPEGVAAFDAVVTSIAKDEGFDAVLAMAMYPDLWLPLLQSATESFGLQMAQPVLDAPPLIIPTLATQITSTITCVLNLVHQFCEPLSPNGPSSTSPRPPDSKRHHTPPAPDGGGPETQGQSPARECVPRVQHEDVPGMSSEHYEVNLGAQRSDLYTMFYFHYGPCHGNPWKPQFFMGVHAGAPGVVTRGSTFAVRIGMEFFGSQWDEDGYSPNLRCPDNATDGCRYRMQETMLGLDDPHKLFSFRGPANLLLQTKTIPGRPHESAPEDDSIFWLGTGLSVACFAAGVALAPLTAGVSLAASLACAVGETDLWFAEYYEREEAKHAAQRSAVAAVVKDSPPVGAWGYTAEGRLTRKPTQEECPYDICALRAQRQADITFEYPEEAGMSYPSWSDHVIQPLWFFVLAREPNA